MFDLNDHQSSKTRVIYQENRLVPDAQFWDRHYIVGLKNFVPCVKDLLNLRGNFPAERKKIEGYLNARGGLSREFPVWSGNM